MNNIQSELQGIITQLEAVNAKKELMEIDNVLQRVEKAIARIEKSASGSWIGYQANVYYENFSVPPPDAQFSPADGLQFAFSSDTTGDWTKYDADEVKNAIFDIAGCDSLDSIETVAKESRRIFEDCRAEIISIFATLLRGNNDPYLDRLQEEIEADTVAYPQHFINVFIPKRFATQDIVAATQGMQIPPHKAVLAQVMAIKNAFNICDDLARRLKRMISHMERQLWYPRTTQQTGTKIFIGHGRSPVWKDLKDFLQDRLKLPIEEFNRVPIAGKTNIERLSEMLNQAAFAFIIMTAEDEQPDNKYHARMNVIHEAGLFQGRLGFAKAIIVLEEGCEEFSNIQGLGQIRFPKEDITAKFEEIRRVLEETGLIATTA